MNILGFNIGQNYKGILNLGSTINSPLSGTLQAVTDGMGNASPLQLSTDSLKITSSLNGNVSLIFENTNNGGFGQLWNAGNALSTYTLQWRGFNTSGAGGRIYPEGMFIGAQSAPSARLHVRGDGTNPIARFENNAGTLSNLFLDSGMLQFGQFGSFVNIYPAVANDLNTAAINGSAMVFRTNVGTNSANSYSYFFRSTNGGSTIQSLAGTNGFINMTGAGFSAAAGSANYRHLEIGYSINNSGAQTGTATGIFLNATETALNGMTHNLIDLQMNSVTRFSVSRLGALTAEGITSNSNIITAATASYQWLSRSRMNSPSDGVITLFNNGSTDFNRLQFGGTTNAFPALKRNGVALQVVFADDSGFANLRCADLNSTSITNSNTGVVNLNFVQYVSAAGVSIGNNTLNASAILQADSTTRGFLPPRGDNGQMLAIASPAAGLIFYDTTNNTLNYYNGTTWISL